MSRIGRRGWASLALAAAMGALTLLPATYSQADNYDYSWYRTYPKTATKTVTFEAGKWTSNDPKVQLALGETQRPIDVKAWKKQGGWIMRTNRMTLTIFMPQTAKDVELDLRHICLTGDRDRSRVEVLVNGWSLGVYDVQKTELHWSSFKVRGGLLKRNADNKIELRAVGNLLIGVQTLRVAYKFQSIFK